MRPLVNFLVFAAWLCLAGCDNPQQKIIGKWKVIGDPGDVVWDFSAKGNVTIGDSSGRYTFGDGDRIKIQTSRATFVYRMEFVGDRMIWTDPSGTKTELARVK